MGERRELRVSDAERQAVADRLLAAMSKGRLDLGEYDRRLTQAYDSVSFGDLNRLLADLPAGRSSVALRRPAAAIGIPAVPTALKVLWAVWLAMLAIAAIIWSVVKMGSGAGVPLWPVWLLVAGAPLPGVTVGAVAARRCR